MRSEEDVKRLMHTLRTRMWDDYEVDFDASWHSDWKRLIEETIRTGASEDNIALLQAEHDAVMCVALVLIQCNPLMFNVGRINVWISHARHYARHHPDIDPGSMKLMTMLGYAKVRTWDS